MRRERRPDPRGVGLAVVPGLASVALLAAEAAALGVGVLGVAVVAVGALRGSHRLVTAGAAGAFVALLLAGMTGTPPTLVLVATVGLLVTWDAATHAVSLGAQLGPEAEIRRSVLVKMAGTTLAAGATGTAGYVVYLFAAGGQPVTALLLLLGGSVLLILALEP